MTQDRGVTRIVDRGGRRVRTYHREDPTRPGQQERRRMRERGLAWCRGCEDWLPLDEVAQGACRPHLNEENRRRYRGDVARKKRQKVRARKRGVAPVPVVGQDHLLEAFDGLCAYCTNEPGETWDHVVPVSEGGETRPGNIVPACASCNSSKRDRVDLFDWMRDRGVEGHPHLENTLILAALA